MCNVPVEGRYDIFNGIICLLNFIYDMKLQIIAIRLSKKKIMAPCKRQLKATRHLICSSCSNWVDFVKSRCEKSWTEVQADSFSFECRGCTRMKELEVELEQLRLLIVAVVGREQVGCASGSGGGTVEDKVGEDDERDAE